MQTIYLISIIFLMVIGIPAHYAIILALIPILLL